MSLGMLKLFKYLVPFLLLSVSGCSLYQGVHQDEPELIALPHQDINLSEASMVEKTVVESEQNSSKPLQVSKQISTPEPKKIITEPIVRASSTDDIEDHKNFAFDLIQKGYEDNNTLFVIGGIQGDEPGGFVAASLIATRYKITKGSLWVIPNLNFYSIIKRSRGPFGDMNRKFADLEADDPDYETIRKIKAHIIDERVKLIVNLHDGSGFYRDSYVDSEHSPHKWGQCSIIDQEKLDCPQYGSLKEISARVVEHVNENLIDEEHRYWLNNTKTAQGNEEMAKTLTYYAIKNNKAAFGNEASKNLPTHERVYYHLLALEKYMHIMGIEFEREFELTPLAVKGVISNNIYLSIEGNSISLPLSDVRNILKYFPVNKDGSITYMPSNPLLKIVKDDNTYTVYYGNRRLTHLKADYVDYLNREANLHFKVDNKDTAVKFGDILSVENDFLVHEHEGYRVNVIGYSTASKKETGTRISKEKFLKNYSVDNEGLMYRIEFYKQDKFAGTVLVKFCNS
jgi:hypothetical protein